MNEEEKKQYLDAIFFIFMSGNYTKEQAIDFIKDEINTFERLMNKEKIDFEFRYNYMCYHDVLTDLLNNYYS